jgi:hypothetical protein
MGQEPMQRCAGTARWTQLDSGPTPTEAAEVTQAARRGEPVLIVLDRRPEPKHVLAEELAEAPPEITALVTSVAGEVAQLDIPPLRWLPGHLAERGRRFLHEVTATVAHTPALLLPALILRPPEGTDPVWFGLRVRSASWSIDELMAAADHMMRERRRAA